MKTYADDKVSTLSATVEGHYRYLLDGIEKVRIDTNAGLESIQNEQEAYARQFASYREEIDGKITQADAEIITLANKNQALSAQIASLNGSIAGVYEDVEKTVDGAIAKTGLVTYNGYEYVAGVQIIGDNIHIGGNWGTSTYFNTQYFYLKRHEFYWCKTVNGNGDEIYYLGSYTPF